MSITSEPQWLQTVRQKRQLRDDAIQLCDFVTEGRYQPHELQPFVSSMLHIAIEGQQSSQEMNERFREVRRGLLEVSCPKCATPDARLMKE